MQLIGLLGVLVMIGLAALASENRSRIPWRLVAAGVAVQAGLAAVLLALPVISDGFTWLARAVTGVIDRAAAGISFIFGPELGDPNGPMGVVFAIHVLPVIIFFASLMAVLYHVGVMQRLIAALAWLMRRTLGVTGAEAMAMAANVFVGQTEAPLTVKPLIDRMTRAQLMTLMVGGFATIAGSVFAAYVQMLGGEDPAERIAFARHLITASVMSAPAAFVMARILVPEIATPPDEHLAGLGVTHDRDSNVLDAAAAGATDGLKLALNVGAMLIAFLSLLALVNWPLELLSGLGPIEAWREAHGIPVLSLEVILGWLLAPLAWCLGVPWAEAQLVGSLLGQKVLVTEFVAFANLGDALHPGDGAAPLLSERSGQIAAYALCGFANFGSIAIQIGGLSAIAPGRRKDFAALALRAMLGGALASWMTASIAGVFIGGR
ncbi:MAG: nucleoside transporter C-terminal domain-containing protein [Planctomycetota bacterium]